MVAPADAVATMWFVFSGCMSLRVSVRDTFCHTCSLSLLCIPFVVMNTHTYRNTYYFSLVVLSTCPMLCNRHLCLVPPRQRQPCSHSAVTPQPPLPSLSRKPPLKLVCLLSCLFRAPLDMDSPRMAFCASSRLLRVLFARSIHVVACVTAVFLFWPNNILCMNKPPSAFFFF